MADILTKDEFAEEVLLLSKERGSTCLEVLSEVLEKYNIDPEDAKAYVSEPLFVRLEAEANRLNLVKRSGKTKRLF